MSSLSADADAGRIVSKRVRLGLRSSESEDVSCRSEYQEAGHPTDAGHCIVAFIRVCQFESFFNQNVVWIMVSGPSPDAKEAVKLDLSQIRAGLRLNFLSAMRINLAEI
jgi:hypothetical protein